MPAGNLLLPFQPLNEGAALTLREHLRHAEQELASGPHPDRARLDAETLLLHALQQDRAWLITRWDDQAEAATAAKYDVLVARRKTGEPIQYITGSSEFFGLPFSVGPGALIPRPETEHLVEEVLRLAKAFEETPLRIADIGTGSGIIAVALAHSLPSAQISAIDSSPQALAIARENAKSHDLESRIEFFEGDLFTPLTGQSFQVIASNPPYIPVMEKDALSIEVREHEPHSALFAGDDGLEIYRRLIPGALDLLVPNGWLVLEIGFGQQPAIEVLLQSAGYSQIHFIPDYQGIPRVAAAQRS
jgi:release factor glutamine methyltransferase